MKWTCTALMAAVVSLWGGSFVHTQDRVQKNPLEGNAEAIRAGMGLFRVRCADCHGMDARGVRSPDLTQVWASGKTDEGLFQILRTGVPGTEMPPVARATDEDLWKILAYLKTLSAPASTDPLTGDAANGERIFRAHCAYCHRVNGVGGRFGPDLTRVGVSRTRATIERQIRGAAEDFRPGYEPVTLTAPSGRVIHAVKKNEDLFSIQIMDLSERIQGYLKEDMKEVKNETKSAMPAFPSSSLSQSDANDLLAYLSTLRGR